MTTHYISPIVQDLINDHSLVNRQIFEQTLDETEVQYAVDMGGGVTKHFGLHQSQPICLTDTPGAELLSIYRPGSHAD